MTKKVMDEKGRLFGRISILDIAVVLVVLLLAAALVYKIQLGSVAAEPEEIKQQTILYQYRVDNQTAEAVETIQVGDALFFSIGAQVYSAGTITDIQVQPYQVVVQKVDGTYQLAEMDGRYTLTLSVEGTGIVKDGKYYLDGQDEFGAAAKRSYSTRYNSLSGMVLSVEAVD